LGIVNRLRTGVPYREQSESEVGEGLMDADEKAGEIAPRARVLAEGIHSDVIEANKGYAAAIAIGGGFERAFVLPEWSASTPIGEEIIGSYDEHPVTYFWSWGAQFTIPWGTGWHSCTWFEEAVGTTAEEECVIVEQPVTRSEEYWESNETGYTRRGPFFHASGDSSTSPPLTYKCPGDGPIPTCNTVSNNGTEAIGVYLNLTQLETEMKEAAFPAGGLGAHLPSKHEHILGEYTWKLSYPFGAREEPVALSTANLAPEADEQEIAYALEGTLLHGLEGGTVENPIVPGEHPPVEGQSDPTCKDPVSCATGTLLESQSDLAVGGRGVGLDLTRSYSSQVAAAGVQSVFGYGWSGSFSDHLVLEPTLHLATLVTAEGSTVSFAEGTEGKFTAPGWTQDTLSGAVESGYTLTLADQTKYKFAGSTGLLESVTDRDGNETTLSHGSEGRLEAITDPAGRKITLAYNSEDLVESAKDPMGHTVKYTYEAGNLASVTLPGESSPRWQFKYNAAHQITEMIDGRGGKLVNEYNGIGQLSAQTDPAGHASIFEYEPSQTKITDEATGAVTMEEYNVGHELSSLTHGYGTSSASTESFAYNEAGYVTSITDGNEHTTKYGYDSANDRTSVVDPDKDETKWTYDSTHDVETMTTAKGETTTIKREAHGNPETISRPAPGKTTQTTTYKYGSHGELESVENPLKHVWKYGYDSQGDRTSETDPEGNKRTWEYNEDSQETATVSPRGYAAGAKASEFTTKRELDAQGRALTVTDPLGHTTKYTYDGDGNVETITDANSHTTTYTYNADNYPTKVKEPNGTVTETEYNGDNQVVGQTDGNKNTTKYVRNILGEVTEAIDPLGHKTLKEYDPAGNLKTLTDPEKRTTTYKYDPANRLSEVSYSDGKTPSVKYEYDADGDRTKMTDGTGTNTYTYDELDRLTESKDGHGDVAKYEYDLGNDQTKITYPNGKSVTRAYDKDGRLEKVTDWSSNATKFTYDPDSDLASTVFPSASKDEDKYAYNDADQMSEVKMSKSTETLASLIYTRDHDGQVEGATSKGLPGEEKPGYTYDENNRLTKGAGTAYEYDAANNPTKIAAGTYKYNAADELETGPSLTYAYDELGERSKTTPTAGPATTYAYNQAGDMTGVMRPKEGEKAAIEDAYNGDGVRASQTIAGTTTYLSWDVTEGIPLILNDGTNSYIYGPGGLPVEQINSAGKILYLHHDQQGSTRLLTGSTGKTEATFTYDSYGNQTGHTGTATSPLGYDAQYTSSDTGLIYLRAREYDPGTAQFLTADPLKMYTGEPYSYVGGNPLNYGDPRGLAGESIGEGGCPPEICFAFPNSKETEHAAEALREIGHEIGHTASEVGHSIESVWNEAFGEGESSKESAQAEASSECGEAFTGDQDALIKIAKEAKRNGLSPEDAEVLREWAEEYDVPFRGPEAHPGRPIGSQPHIHVGSQNHIPVW
jgi:RHS repeat-associated protein